MSIPVSTIEELFSDRGILANSLSNYQPRKSQISMALAVHDALENNNTLVCEAGTGTGKTFAYLIPAIQYAITYNRQVVISTATKNLQDQLYLRDLPKLLNIFKFPLSYAQIKGRSNYLCLLKLHQVTQNNRLDDKLLSLFHYIKRIHRQTHWGELSEFSKLQEDSIAWRLVTSKLDECSVQDCTHFEECYLYKARENAQFAHLVVVNHHLLMSDRLSKQQGKLPLLGDFNACIIDEAHQLSDIASNFYTVTLSSAKLKTFLKDCLQANQQEAGEKSRLPDEIERLQQLLDEFSYCFNQLSENLSWLFIKQQMKSQLVELKKCFSTLTSILEYLATLGKALEHCHQRAKQLQQILSRVLDTVPEQGYIHWLENSRQGFAIHLTPVNIAEHYDHQVHAKEVSWIYTSATLSSLNNLHDINDTFVNDAFENNTFENRAFENNAFEKRELDSYFKFFSQQLGIQESSYLSFSSPFNYSKQALFYHPPQLPEPGHDNFIPQLVDTTLPVVNRLQGKSFYLFTSYRSMHAAYELLSKNAFNILMQGQFPKQELLNRFIDEDNSILLGTYSFWQGVDVPGQALSCVIIEKVPFASPYEPVMAARLERLKSSQRDPFYEYQIPQAIISLKQGIGRLIRSVSDYGVLIIAG